MELRLSSASLPQRLKSFLRDQGISGTYWKALKAAGALQVNGETIQRDLLLQPGTGYPGPFCRKPAPWSRKKPLFPS